MIPTSPYRQGFSLVELSVALVILGIVIIGGMEATAMFMARTAYNTTLEKAQALDEAIAAYYRVYGRLPCPARRNFSITNTSYGKAAACDANTDIAGTSPLLYEGMVPVRNLNLPLSMAIDGYGSKFNYVVTGVTADANPANDADGIDMRSGTLANSQDLGDAAYVIFSNGADRRGSVTSRGIQVQACGPAPRIDSENCDYANAIFYDSRYNVGSVPGNYFDDIIVWRSRAQLFD